MGVFVIAYIMIVLLGALPDVDQGNQAGAEGGQLLVREHLSQLIADGNHTARRRFGRQAAPVRELEVRNIEGRRADAGPHEPPLEQRLQHSRSRVLMQTSFSKELTGVD